MRLHEAIRNLNIGLDTAAEFLASKGMPLEDRNLNVRLRDMQCSLLYREFGYKPQAKQLRSSVAHEKPEVQAVLNEIHHAIVIGYQLLQFFPLFLLLFYTSVLFPLYHDLH